MNEFIDLFDAIDTNDSGKIIRGELEQYSKKNNLDNSMVNKWFGLFDAENTGYITLNNICEVLSLDLEQTKCEMAEKKKIHSKIQIIDGKMKKNDERKIIEEILKLESKYGSSWGKEGSHFIDELKSWLDAEFDQFWHVVAIKGSYWAKFSHIENKSMSMMHKNISYLLWMTNQ
uniref:Tegument antigen n=1 Tax=Lepeophtheirus salmonis TaxID=72036 RepID=D3PJ97_LEPSM|nr:Tegument antigen [Lepeophtheirus salmonis]